MSGNFGWSGGSGGGYSNSGSSYGGSGSKSYYDDNDRYDEAKKSYSPNAIIPKPPQKVKIGNSIDNSLSIGSKPVDPVITRKQVVAAKKTNVYPDARHSLKSTASNVIIVVQDVTRSMNRWPDEIFKRLPLLYHETCDYLGISNPTTQTSDDLEILFIAHGDARTDSYPLQVAPAFGKGPELDDYLASFYTDCGGGGQGSESQELVAYYLLKQVDTTSANNVYTFFITDEAACDQVDSTLVYDHFGLNMDRELFNTKTIFESLQRRGKVFTILCDTSNYDYDKNDIKNSWENLVGKNNILPLNDSRRVVDTMLGSIAKLTGNIDTFSKNLMSRQQGSKYQDVNIAEVNKSISLIGNGPGTPSTPKKTKKSLI